MTATKTKFSRKIKEADATLTLTVEVNEKDPKWNGYDCKVQTGEFFKLAISNASIWGIWAWAKAVKELMGDETYDALAKILQQYPR